MHSFIRIAVITLLAATSQAIPIVPHDSNSTNAHPVNGTGMHPINGTGLNPTNNTGTCTTNQRKAWHRLTDVEKAAYIDAELCLMNGAPRIFDWAQNRWDEIVYGHLAQTAYMHDVGAFLPWHRFYVRIHEYLLQTECGYKGAQPYWDEAPDVDNLAASVVFDPVTGFGSEGDECVTDGPFANTTLHVNRFSNNANYCLARNFNPAGFQGANASRVEDCFEKTTYVDAHWCYHEDPHTAGHRGVGGSMLDVVASPSDPIFFLHHTYLDSLWWKWQMADPEVRLKEVGGRNMPSEAWLGRFNLSMPGPELSNYSGDDGNITTLSHVLWGAGLVENKTIADVMDIHGAFICADYV